MKTSQLKSISENLIDTFNDAGKVAIDLYEKGLKILKNIESEKPFGYTKADLYNYMGFASRKQKNPNYENAENYYLKALSLDGDHIGALEYLGELYFETNREDMARSLLDRLGTIAGESSNEYKELYNLLN